jgi:hypothetical protein
MTAPSPFAIAAQHYAERIETQARLDTQVVLSTYLDDPVGFCDDLIDWRDEPGLAPYQREILAKIPTEKRVSVRGPHGLGKTTTKALALLWFALTRDAAGIDWKIPTTAGAWRQLEQYLWPEIHKWAKRIRWDLILDRGPLSERTELLMLNLRLEHGSAFAVASDDPALIEGVHADHVLYLFDESKAIRAATFDAAEGAFSGATDGRVAYALAQSTPGEPQGRFYDIHSRKPGLEDWWARHVTLGEVIAAERVSQTWSDQRALQWGTESAVYFNRVLGEFHSSDSDAVIPLSWVEAANERWKAWDEAGRVECHGRRVVGVDVARSGEDKTVMAIRQGNCVEELRADTKQDTMATAGKVGGLLATPHALAVVDTDGLGAGVTDRLRELNHRVLAFHAGTKTSKRDRSGELGFVNTRSAAWWNLREMLDPAYGEDVMLPPDDELIGDLTAPHWTVESGSKIAVESRDSLVKTLGRSPDHGTAVMQAFWTTSESTAAGAVVSYDLYADLAV